MNVKEKLQELIQSYEQDIVYYQNGGYYFQEREYKCDQARARKLEEVVADLKAIVETIWFYPKTHHNIIMKFILSEPVKEKQLTFADVAVNQFFVNLDSWLCQKVSSNAYIVITNSKGEPMADYYGDEAADELIERILPNVERIEF